jgi:hypothetical protein
LKISCALSVQLFVFVKSSTRLGIFSVFHLLRPSWARVPQVFIDQLMGHAGGLAQTYAKASEEYRRAAIDKLEAFIHSKVQGSIFAVTQDLWVN